MRAHILIMRSYNNANINRAGLVWLITRSLRQRPYATLEVGAECWCVGGLKPIYWPGQLVYPKTSRWMAPGHVMCAEGPHTGVQWKALYVESHI